MSKDNLLGQPSIPPTLKLFEPSILVGENIESQLFVIAKEHDELASHDIDRDDVEKTRKEMKHSIIAIVMSFTALEALSNNLFKILTGKNFKSKKFKKFDRNKRGLIGKWEELAELAFRTNSPNKEFILTEDFSRLLIKIKNLRHAIIHYKPRVESPDVLKKFPDNSPLYTELEQFNSNEARKAVETVREFLDNFEKNTGYKVPKLD
ncbi:MAG: hypothetical protein RIG61_11935 [Deltaproteobacteria bacterium]